MATNVDIGTRIRNAGKYVVPAIVIAAVIAPVFVSLNSNTITPPLTVVASVNQSAGNVGIAGRVLQDGAPIDKATVWTVVDFEKGQHASPAPAQTDGTGGFTIGPLTGVPGAVADATIYARKVIPGHWFKADETLRGQDLVQLAGETKPQPDEFVPLPLLSLLPLAFVFAASFLLPFFFEQTMRKYRVGVVLAFAATLLMIVYISLGLQTVTKEGKSKEILQLGFASIYRSSYVKDVPLEWVFSFTAPPAKRPEAPAQSPPANTTPAPAPEQTPAKGNAPPQNPSGATASQPAIVQQAATPVQPAAPDVDHGFGAPLWVILVSVLGASVVTVGLIVGEITKIAEIAGGDAKTENSPAGNGEPAVSPKVIREHIQTLVQHQFFILFAPITAIFVYQALVVGAAASSSLMVGLAALGAGPSLSALLTKAGAAATKLFQ